MFANTCHYRYFYKPNPHPFTIMAKKNSSIKIPKKAKKIALSSVEPVKNKVFIEESTTPAPVTETPKKMSVKEQRRANAEKAKEENK